jgi:intein/homing endonuclease
MGLRNTNQVLLKDFQLKFYKTFGKEPAILRDGRCATSSKEIYSLLTEKGESYYSWHWRLPKLNKINLASWLRSYFDADGWVINKHRQSRLIGLDSVNKKGIFEIKEALKRFNISSKIRKHRYLHRLHIYGRGNLLRFQKYIGLLHPKKSKILSEALMSYVDYDWKFPKSKREMVWFVKKLLKSKLSSGKRIRISSIRLRNLSILRHHLKSLFDVDSKVYGPMTRGTDSTFYELCIHKKGDILKIEKL